MRKVVIAKSDFPESSGFTKPIDKIEDMLHDSYSLTEAIKNTEATIKRKLTEKERSAAGKAELSYIKSNTTLTKMKNYGGDYVFELVDKKYKSLGEQLIGVRCDLIEGWSVADQEEGGATFNQSIQKDKKRIEKLLKNPPENWDDIEKALVKINDILLSGKSKHKV